MHHAIDIARVSGATCATCDAAAVLVIADQAHCREHAREHARAVLRIVHDVEPHERGVVGRVAGRGE
ncbi:MAG: hypothetical protein IT374_26140 [Polyangiaceae bacterium]|nr:hypothetical protein [Polyangiaceae bacterium]